MAPEVVKADGNVLNLAWRICNAKRVLVSNVSLCNRVESPLTVSRLPIACPDQMAPPPQLTARSELSPRKSYPYVEPCHDFRNSEIRHDGHQSSRTGVLRKLRVLYEKVMPREETKYQWPISTNEKGKRRFVSMIPWIIGIGRLCQRLPTFCLAC